MAGFQDLFDRLTGVSIVRERLVDLKRDIEEYRRFLLDHERRIAKLEAHGGPIEALPAPKKAKRRAK